MAKNWNDLFNSLPPERQKRIEAKAEALREEEMALREARKVARAQAKKKTRPTPKGA